MPTLFGAWGRISWRGWTHLRCVTETYNDNQSCVVAMWLCITRNAMDFLEIVLGR